MSLSRISDQCAGIDAEFGPLGHVKVEDAEGRVLTPCEDPECRSLMPGQHAHDPESGRWLPACSWHPGEFHGICSDAAR